MIAKVKAWFVWLWQNHIQKTMAYVMGALLGVNIVGYADPIKELVGAKGFDVLLLALAAVVGIRAHAAAPPTPPSPPPDIP